MSNVIPINSRAIAAAAIRAKLREAANASGRSGSLEDTIDLIRYKRERIAWLAPPRYQAEALRALEYICYELPINEEALRRVLICLYVLDTRYVTARDLAWRVRKAPGGLELTMDVEFIDAL